MSALGFVQGAAPLDYPRENPRLYINAHASFGTGINPACDDAISAAKRLGLGVRFVFNGIPVYAWPSSTTAELVDGWRRAFGADQ